MPLQMSLIQSIIAATGLKVQVGGGIRSTENIRDSAESGRQPRGRRNQSDDRLALV